MKDTLNEYNKSELATWDYRIELFDIDNDGIPELQDTRNRATQPPCIYAWFIVDGVTKHIVFRHPESLGWNDSDYVTGMYINNETGALIAENIYAHHQFGFYHYFVPDNSGEIWNMVSAVGFSTPDVEQPAEYEYIDCNGVRQSISKYEYDSYREIMLEGYTLLKGDILRARDCYPWSDESAKVISDYFDAYDGVESSVYLLP
jgi:hypothetical protein